MQTIFGVLCAIIFAVLGFVSIAAAWGGFAWLIGPVIGSGLMLVCLFFRLSIVVTPVAFLGAWKYWDLPWYWAVLIAAPGIIIAVPALGAALGATWLDRRHRNRG